MANNTGDAADCTMCGGDGVLIGDKSDGCGGREDDVQPCPAKCRGYADDEREVDEVDRPAMVLSYDERPFDGDRDFAGLDGARW